MVVGAPFAVRCSPCPSVALCPPGGRASKGGRLLEERGRYGKPVCRGFEWGKERCSPRTGPSPLFDWAWPFLARFRLLSGPLFISDWTPFSQPGLGTFRPGLVLSVELWPFLVEVSLLRQDLIFPSRPLLSSVKPLASSVERSFPQLEGSPFPAGLRPSRLGSVPPGQASPPVWAFTLPI